MKVFFGITLCALASTSLAASPALAADKEPLRLKPSSKWTVDYQDDGCRLLRTFGTDKEQIFLAVEKFGPSESFGMSLAGDLVVTKQGINIASLKFGEEQAQDSVYSIGQIGDAPALIFNSKLRIAPLTKVEEDSKKKDDSYKVEAIATSRYSSAQTIAVKGKIAQAFVLETGSLEKPFAALDACVTDLVSGWGIDTEKHKNLSRKVTPKTDPGNWLLSNDYPIDMIREGQPALIDFRLIVAEDGKTTECFIQKTTRAKEFDDAVCGALLKRSRFDPALDADGKPIKSYWRNSVRFTMPSTSNSRTGSRIQ